MSTSSYTKVAELLRLLRVRVEDTNDLAFSPQHKYDALDNAQRYICTVIHNNYLSSFEREKTIESEANGTIPLTEIESDGYGGIFRNEIISVKGTIDNINRYFKKIEVKDVGKFDNQYLEASYSNPMHYIFNDTIHLLPSQQWDVVVSYIKEPDPIYNPHTTNVATNCELELVLIDPLLDFAEAYLWKMDNKQNRTKMAMEIGINTINLLNQRFEQERKIGVGSVGRND